MVTIPYLLGTVNTQSATTHLQEAGRGDRVYDNGIFAMLGPLPEFEEGAMERRFSGCGCALGTERYSTRETFGIGRDLKIGVISCREMQEEKQIKLESNDSCRWLFFQSRTAYA